MNLTLEVPGGSAASGTSLDDLASEIESSCEYLRRTADTTASTRTGCSVADCTDHLCGAIESICRAETYMRLAASPTAQFPYSSDGLSTDGLAGVSAVTAEARAGLARMAIESAAASLDLVDRGINAYSGAATGACLNNPYDANLPATTTLGAAHAETFVAALAALQDANELYRSHAAAVGDSIISEYGPIEGADGNSHGENLALRGAAAGYQVSPGGTPCRGAGVADAFCAAAPLSPGAARALALVRRAAPDPTAVLAVDVTAGMGDSLLEGWLAGPGFSADDGIIARLATLDATLPPTPTQDDFLEATNLEVADFLSAIEYLREELTTFDRDRVALLPAEQTRTGAPSTRPLYAATRTPPSPMDREVSAAWARCATGTFDEYGDGNPSFTPTLYDSSSGIGGVSETLQMAAAAARRMASELNEHYGTTDLPGRFTDIYDVLTVPDQHRLDVCLEAGSGTGTLTVTVYDRTEGQLDGAFGLVVGKGGYECVATGYVEGQSCSPSTRTIPAATTGLASTLSATEADATGYDRSRELTFQNSMGMGSIFDSLAIDSADPDATTLLFLTHTPSGGEPEVIAGFPFRRGTQDNTNGYEWCASYAIDAETVDWAAELRAPFVEDCALSDQDCSGLPRGQRLPLENELTDDGSPVESSWRHYLQLARRAAAEADRLGEQLIGLEAELDRQAQSSIDELQDICGGPIDIRELPTRAETAGSDFDPLAWAAANRSVNASAATIDSCLGGGSEATRATLGGQALCLWWDGTNEQTVCQDSGGSGQCPRVRPDGGCPTQDSSMNPILESGFEWLEITEVLGFFQADATEFAQITGGAPPQDESAIDNEGLDPTSSVPLECQRLAGVRRNITQSNLDVLESLLASQPGFFSLDNLQSHSRRLGLEVHAGDYASVSLGDNGAWITTGHPITGPSTANFPFERPEALDALCPDGTSVAGAVPLFCNSFDLTNRTERAQANDMLIRAVLAARILTGTSLRGLQVPYYPRLRGAGARQNDGYLLASTDFRPVSAVAGGFDWWVSGDGERRFIPNANRQRPLSEIVDVASIEFLAHPMAPDGCEPTGASEWWQCPWDLPSGAVPVGPSQRSSGCLEVFDNATDCDDLTDRSRQTPDYELFSDGEPNTNQPGNYARYRPDDRNSVFVAMTLGEGTDGSQASATVGEIWGAGRNRVLAEPQRGSAWEGFLWDIFAGADDPTARPAQRSDDFYRRSFRELTSYFARIFCGTSNDDASAGNAGGNDVCDELSFAPEACMGFGGYVDSRLAVGWPLEHEGDGRSNGVASQLAAVDALDDVDALQDCGFDVGCTASNWPDCFHASGIDGDFQEVFRYPATVDGNRAFIAPNGLSSQDYLNGLELLCAASIERPNDPFGIDTCNVPQAITSMRDLLSLDSALECAANRIETNASLKVIRLPSAVISVLQRISAGPGAQLLGEGDYEMAAAADELVGALVAVRGLEQTIGAAYREAANAIDAADSQLSILDAEGQIADRQLEGRVASLALTCATAVIDAAINSSQIGIKGLGAIGHQWLKAGLQCADSVFQSQIAVAVNELGDEIEGERVRQVFLDLDTRTSNALTQLNDIATSIEAQTRQISASVIRMEALRRRGRRALSNALLLESDDSGTYFAANTGLFQRYNGTLERYQRGRRNAVRLAFLAKRSVEQRLGMRMAEMTSPLPLLDEPPANWHMSLCRTSGVDAALSEGSSLAEEFVSDYVDRLEAVVESYSLAYPFQDGTDSAVLSLRDAIGRPVQCRTASANLLLASESISSLPSHAEAGTQYGWVREGCVSYDPWPPIPPDPTEAPEPPPSCIVVSPAATGARPYGSTDQGEPLRLRTIEFGAADHARLQPSGVVITDADTVTPARTVTDMSSLVQTLAVDPGVYRISWFGRPVTPGPCGVTLDPSTMVSVELEHDGLAEPATMVPTIASSTTSGLATNVTRYWQLFEVPRSGSVVHVRISSGQTSIQCGHADLGGLMLERLATRGSGISTALAEVLPADYIDGQLPAELAAECAAQEAAQWEGLWVRGYAERCRNGALEDCGTGGSVRDWFREAELDLDPDRLRERGIGAGPGFAFGNYNYRVEAIGVNVVGTGIRDCERVEGGQRSACYANASLAYSLRHVAPFLVRNHEGDMYQAPLFPGRIEYARALSAERYLTSPLSSADSSLLEPFVRSEFAGRPLRGPMVLRIWDEPALRWENVEDIQLVVRYRYWTRQE
jgi:hypothetical protein